MSTKQYRRIRKATAKVIEALESRMLLTGVSGVKFSDLDRDGYRDAGEPGLAGWTIYADLDTDGQLDAGEPSTLSGADGSYVLSDLGEGQYHIREVSQAGWMVTAPTAGGRLYAAADDPLSGYIWISELNPQTGAVINSFAAPENAIGVGPQGLAVGPNSLFFVQGWDDTPHTLYELDLNTGAVIDSDVIDAADPIAVDGIAYLDGKLYFQRFSRQQILVFDPVTDVTVTTLSTPTTDVAGGIAGDPGTHTLLASNMDGAIFRIDPATGESAGVVADAGTFVAGLAVVDGVLYAAPYNYTGSLYLFDAMTGEARGTMSSALNGASQIGALGGDGLGSGPGKYVVTLTAGQQRSGYNFGAYANVGSISGVKFNDLDRDGYRDAGEPGLAGWTIYADLDTDGQLDAGEPSTVTSADGSYVLSGLNEGQYHIREVPQAGWTATTPLAGGRLYVASDDPWSSYTVISELNPQTGAVINSFLAPANAMRGGLEGLAVGPDSLFYMNGRAGGGYTLYELNLDTGAIIDSDVVDPLDPADIDGIAYLDGKLYLHEFSGPQILVFDPVTDTTVATLVVTGTGGHLIVYGGMAGDPATHTLLMAGLSPDIYRVDPATGQTIGMGANVGGYIGGLAVVDGVVYVAPIDYLGSVYLYDAMTGESRGTLSPALDGVTRIGALGGDGLGNRPGEYVVTLTGGQERSGYDFGNAQLGEIHGTKFQDSNGDGVRQETEPGLAGWTMYLDLDGDGVLDAGEPTSVTDAAGQYAFTDLPPGDYVVEEVQQAGWVQTSPRGDLHRVSYDASNNPVVQRIDPLTGAVLGQMPLPPLPNPNYWWGAGLADNGKSLFYVAGSGSGTVQTLYELDRTTGAILDSDLLPTPSAGGYIIGPAVLGDTVYVYDVYANDIIGFDTVSDTVVSRVTFHLANPGKWIGGDMAALRGPGRLVVHEVSTRSIAEIDPATGVILSSFPTGLPDSEYATYNVFGYGLAAVDDTIYLGRAASQVYSVSVYRRDGVPLRTLPSSQYFWGLGGDDVGVAVHVAAGQETQVLDFGNAPLGEIRGTKYYDTNRNGMKDVGEPGLSGWTIYIDTDGDGELDANEQTAITDATGQYVFTNLMPGSYLIDEVGQAGWKQSGPQGGRLFATQVAYNVPGWPGGPAIAELDLATLEPIRAFAQPIEGGWWGDDLAFNGSHLFFLRSSDQTPESNMLYEVDPETGAVLDSDLLPANYYYGLAVLGNTVYALTLQSQVVVFDTVTDTVVRTMDIPALNGNTWGFSCGLTALRGPGRLVGYDYMARQFVEIDADTGLELGRFGSGLEGQVPFGLAAADGKVYATWSTGSGYTVDVYGADRALERSVAHQSYTWALGGDDVVARTSLSGGIAAGPDFGNYQAGEIRGTKFQDSNGDGIRQANEPGLSGWTMYLDLDRDGSLDANEPTALTNADGVYQFTDLSLGDYVVEEVPQTGWAQTYPVNNLAWGVRAQWDPTTGSFTTVAVHLDPATGAALGQIPLPGDPGWWGDGLAFNGSSLFYRKDQSSTELYEIDPATGAILDVDNVSTSGAGLAVIGKYVYLQTSLGFDVFDSETDTIVRSINVVGANDGGIYVYGPLTVLRGPAQLIGFDTMNARFVVLDPETGLALRSFGQAPVDSWGNMVPPSGLAVQGERIYAYFSFDGQTIVDTYGRDGSYLGRGATPQDPGNPDTYTWAISSDDIGAAVHLAAGQEMQVLDFGNAQYSEVRGTKYNDLNGNGQRDAGEPGLADWTVYLDLNRNHQRDEGEPSTVTDTEGQYSFAGLEPGDYVVETQRPAGWRQTTRGGRMFAATTDQTNSIVELDPITGAELRRFTSPVPLSGWADGLAFDGVSLFLCTPGSDVQIWEINPDTGALVRTIAVPAGAYDGLAVLGNELFLQKYDTSDIVVLDKVTGEVLRTLDIDGLSGGLTIVGGLGAIHGPDALIATSGGGLVLYEIDPQTGVITRQTVLELSANWGVSAADGGIWLGFSDGQRMRYYSRSGALQAYGMPLGYGVSALAGDDNGRTVQVRGGVVPGIDFGYVHDSDAGDTMATATPITLDQIWRDLATGAIGDGVFGDRDVDMYRFTATVHDRIVLSSNSGTWVRLFDANGAQIGAMNQSFYPLSSTGTYYLGVSGRFNQDYNAAVANSGTSGELGAYTLSGIALPDVSDTLAAAPDLVGQVEAIGDGMAGDADVDMYRVWMNAGDTLDVGTGFWMGNQMDTVLRVFNTNGTEVAFNDNAYPSGGLSRIVYKAPSAGYYYVGVSGAWNASYDPSVAGSGSAGSTGDYQLFHSLTPDTTPPTVTINQAANQVDPTRSTSILFEVVFSESVTGFTASDVVLSGTAGASTATVFETGPMDGTSYLVFVTGMAQQGTVIASIPAGAAADVAGLASQASTSTDNSVYFDVLPNVSSFRVNNGAAQRSMVKTLTVTFTEPVTLSGALTLRLHSGANVANVTMGITNPSGDGMTYVAAFSGSAVIGGSLPDGIYDVVLNGSAVTDATGNAVADTRIWTFHRLFGDADGNKVVNALDYARLRNTLGRSSSDPLFNSSFDYEGNSLINALDLARFRQRYGMVYSY